MRLELPRPIGFVFGGGGSLGAVQVGMLKAVFEREITPDMVVGTSIGAFNGAVVAYDPKVALATLEEFWRNTRRQHALPLRGLKPLLHWRRTHQSLYPNIGLAQGIRRTLPSITSFSQLQLPFAAVAIDLVSGLPIVFREGDLESALLASSAIPGLFPPVNRDGRSYYDGGLGNGVPMRDAVAMGAKSLVVFDTSSPTADLTQPKGLTEFVTYVTEVYSRQIVRRDIAELAHIPMVYPPSPASPTLSPVDLSHTEELLLSGYLETAMYLDSLGVITGSSAGGC